MRRQILFRILFVTLTAASGFVAGNAWAGLKTLHSFCNTSNCTDGNNPLAGLVMDASGNLYGTTEQGGKFNSGLVFKLIPNANKTKYTEHILKNFCAKPSCTDGSFPEAGLIIDSNGALYGATGGGGKFGAGAVFKMHPVTNGWAYGVIHSFCHDASCSDGSSPETELTYSGQASGQPYDGTSLLFGATFLGGSSNRGEVYKLTPNGSGWTFHVIHSFSSGFHGGELFVDPAGNLIGTTLLGGANSGGELFSLAPSTGTEATLYNFCAKANCADGAQPIGRLLMDDKGNLFGTASVGGAGAHCVSVSGCGVAYEFTSAGKYKVIYNFCSRASCKDGEVPSAGMIMDAIGDLVGTTYEGGTGPGGSVFSLHHGTTWMETVLYNFCSQLNCTDGAGPVAPVIVDSGGNLYGTDAAGGAKGDFGTVFRLKP